MNNIRLYFRANGNKLTFASLGLIVIFFALATYMPEQKFECGGEADHDCYRPLWQILSTYLVLGLFILTFLGSYLSLYYKGIQRGGVWAFVASNSIVLFLTVGLIWLSQQTGH